MELLPYKSKVVTTPTETETFGKELDVKVLFVVTTLCPNIHRVDRTFVVFLSSDRMPTHFSHKPNSPLLLGVVHSKRDYNEY